MRRLFLGLLAAVALGPVLVVAGGGGAAAASDCYATFPYPGFSSYQIEVSVTRRRSISCSYALRVGRDAYALRGLRIEFGSQFGAGGYGGPFHVGHFRCFLLNRGSDFRNAYCRRGRLYVRFYDHRGIA